MLNNKQHQYEEDEQRNKHGIEEIVTHSTERETNSR